MSKKNGLIIHPSWIEDAHTNVMAQELKKAAVKAEVTTATVSDIIPAAKPTWWGMFGTGDTFLDQRIEKELKMINFIPVPPTGVKYTRMIWEHNLLQAIGTTPTPTSPATPDDITLTPVGAHAYAEIDEDAMRQITYEWERAGFTSDPVNYPINANKGVTMTFAYAALNSVMNESIAGSTLWDGWLTLIAAGSPLTYSTLGSEDYSGAVFPGMWNALAFASGGRGRLLNESDISIWCSFAERWKYIQQVQDDTSDVTGTYDRATDTATFQLAKVYAITNWPSNRLVLTTRKNLILGMVDEPLKVDTFFSLDKGRVFEMSSPLHARSIVRQVDNCVYATP